jgi:AcrR family transcriptional regulator
MAENKTPSPFIRELKDDTPVELSSHDRILLSARALFSSQGYENATTSAIARMAGTSESQLIKHFSSKEGLLGAIFDQSWQRFSKGLEQALPKCETPYDKLRALIELILDAMERDKDLRTLMLLEGRRIRKHGSMVVLTDGFLNMVATVDRLLTEMRDTGQLQPDPRRTWKIPGRLRPRRLEEGPSAGPGLLRAGPVGAALVAALPPGHPQGVPLHRD